MKDLRDYTDYELAAELSRRASLRGAERCDYCGKRCDDESCRRPDRHRMAVTAGVLNRHGVKRA